MGLSKELEQKIVDCILRLYPTTEKLTVDDLYEVNEGWHKYDVQGYIRVTEYGEQIPGTGTSFTNPPEYYPNTETLEDFGCEVEVDEESEEIGDIEIYEGAYY